MSQFNVILCVIVTIFLGTMCQVHVYYNSPCRMSAGVPWGLVENCSMLGLTSVPNDLHRLNVTGLDLSQNQIARISNTDLRNFSQLLWLNLSSNSIRSIANGAFSYLRFLEKLNLEDNYLASWPDQSLLPLSNLKQLNLDLAVRGQSLTSLPVGFHGLRNLQTLILSNLYFGVMDREFFQNLHKSSIKSLDLQGVSVKAVRSGALKGFNNISSLKLNAADGFSYRDWCSLFADLNNTTLSSLDLSAVSQMSKLNYTVFRGFKVNRLVDLYLSYTDIAIIENQTFVNLVNLERLSLRSIKITEIHPEMFVGLESLKYLDVSGTEISSVNFSVSMNMTSLDLSYNSNLKKLSSNALAGLRNLQDLTVANSAIQHVEACAFCGLYGLERLDMSDIRLVPGGLSKDAFRRLQGLRELNLRSSGIQYLNKTLLGDLTSLRILTLDNTDLSDSVSPDALVPLRLSLETLSLESCSLSAPQGLFQHLTKLKTLLLTENTNLVPHRDMFKGCDSLSTLSLSYIKTVTSISDIITRKHVPKLKILDVSYCRISHVAPKDIKLIKTLDSFYAHGNPFICDCSIERFVGWMNKTNVALGDVFLYRCLLEDIPINQFDFLYCDHRALVLLITKILTPFVGVSALVSALLYYFKWSIRWRLYKRRLERYRQQELQGIEEEHRQCPFDAFILHSGFSDDEVFVRQTLLPLLEDTDQGTRARLRLTGYFNFDINIPLERSRDDHLDQSRNVIVLLNNNFIDSAQALNDYGVIRDVQSRRRGLGIIVVETGSVAGRMSDLPQSINQIYQQKLQIQWRTTRQGKTFFMRQLREAMREYRGTRPLLVES